VFGVVRWVLNSRCTLFLPIGEIDSWYDAEAVGVGAKLPLKVYLRKELVLKRLHILSAGVASDAARDTAAKWNAEYPDFPAVLDCGSSVDLIRRVLGGERCDLLILADNVIIEKMMMPKYADGYFVFAGNSMVIRAAKGKKINTNNWKDKLLSRESVFTHNDPFGDPGGYRAVMTIMLADQYESGLSAKILNHPGYIGMRRGTDTTEVSPYDYMFYYYTGALAAGASFAKLPATMDLSDDSLADVYSKVSFSIDENTTVIGSPICHAMTIPLGAQNPTQARMFADLFLQYDFIGKGFIQRSKKFGAW